MVNPSCPNCGKSEFRYKQIQHESVKLPRDLVVIVYCINCGNIIGTGAGRA